VSAAGASVPCRIVDTYGQRANDDDDGRRRRPRRRPNKAQRWRLPYDEKRRLKSTRPVVSSAHARRGITVSGISGRQQRMIISAPFSSSVVPLSKLSVIYESKQEDRYVISLQCESSCADTQRQSARDKIPCRFLEVIVYPKWVRLFANTAEKQHKKTVN